MDLIYLIIPGIIASIIVIYYFFFRPKMDKRIKNLAEYAYESAGEFLDLPAKGDPPAVKLVDTGWRNEEVFGLYSWKKLFKWIIWEQITVVDDRSFIWGVLVHEMVHAVRRRNGLLPSEIDAYQAQRTAYARFAGPKLDALMAEVYPE
jgi:hypothetical protein